MLKLAGADAAGDPVKVSRKFDVVTPDDQDVGLAVRHGRLLPLKASDSMLGAGVLGWGRSAESGCGRSQMHFTTYQYGHDADAIARERGGVTSLAVKAMV
jgi:hypothetical protein